ncbi:MAG: hypothetical protein ACJ79H_03570 [Myxococcales bacterium]
MKVRVQASYDQTPVGAALALIPRPLLERVPFRLHCGVDPVFAGLHESEAELPSGWRCRDIAHFLVPGSALDERDAPGVIVLPDGLDYLYCGDAVGAIVHEFAHAVEAVVGYFRNWPAISDYARTLPAVEAFAVAFQHYLVPNLGTWPGAPVGPEAAREAIGRDCLEMLERTLSGRWEFGV